MSKENKRPWYYENIYFVLRHAWKAHTTICIFYQTSCCRALLNEQKHWTKKDWENNEFYSRHSVPLLAGVIVAKLSDHQQSFLITTDCFALSVIDCTIQHQHCFKYDIFIDTASAVVLRLLKQYEYMDILKHRCKK